MDDIVRREELKEKLGKILEMHAVSWKTENRIRTDAAELHHADHPGSDSENLTNDKCDSDRGDSNPAGINLTSQPGIVYRSHARLIVHPAVII